LIKKATQNSWLQAGFLIVAARSLGLDCGPMAGFDADKINAAFYSDSSWRVSMLISLGHGTGENIRDRAARLTFEQACEIV
jgi:nitroreductase